MPIRELLKNVCLKHQISPFDAEILLSLALKKPREYIIAHPEKKLTSLQKKKYEFFSRRRSNGEPIAYITGKKEFFGLDFAVDKNSLVPRPETELLVELALRKIKGAKSQLPDKIIDVGTGSGNIIISIAKNLLSAKRKKTSLYALDVSEKTLRTAKLNAHKYKLNKKIKFAKSNLLDYFFKQKKISGKNIFILANLPYVSNKFYKKNYSDLRFEPKNALVSPQQGLNHYVRLFDQIKKLKKNYPFHVTCFVEISPEQKPALDRKIKRGGSGGKPCFFKDLAGKWRVAEIEIK